MKYTTTSIRKSWFFTRAMHRAYREMLEKACKDRSGTKKTKSAPQRQLFAETLEPRVLFSGTPAPVEEAPDVDPNQDAAQTAEVLDAAAADSVAVTDAADDAVVTTDEPENVTIDGIPEVEFSGSLNVEWLRDAEVERVAKETVEGWEASELTEENFSPPGQAKGDTKIFPSLEATLLNLDEASAARNGEVLADVAKANDRSEIIIVSSGVNEASSLLGKLGGSFEVILLDGGSDEMEQIAELLRGRSAIDAIHLYTHGTTGALNLGTATLNSSTMTGIYADELSIIRGALSQDADLLIYGCDFGAGKTGQETTLLLSSILDADIATTIDHTGAQELGGDWDLELTIGRVETTTLAAKAWQGLLAPGVILVADDLGNDDVVADPNDITALSVDYTDQATGKLAVTVQIDPTVNSGGSTSNIAVIFDTDGDGNANYGFAVSLSGAPTFSVAEFSLVYGKGDGFPNKVSGNTTDIGHWTAGSGWSPGPLATTYTIDTTANDPFDATTDTRVTLNIKLDDILDHWKSLGNSSATYSDIRLVNATTQPSHSVTSAPKDLAISTTAPFTATDDTATTTVGTPVTIDVASNDSLGLSPSSVEIGTGPSNGTVSIGADGKVTYTPTGSFSGIDTFTYQIYGLDGQPRTATVSVTVSGPGGGGNTAPSADDDSFTMSEDGSVSVDVLDGDTDVDGDSLTITQVNGQAITEGGPAVTVTNGTVALVGGELVFTPTENYNGPAGFAYTVSDGTLSTNASVSGLVTPVNDAPDLTNDTFTVDEDGSVTIDVLDNDSDVDGDPMTITHVDGLAITDGGPAVSVTDGTVELVAGELVFTPDPDYSGPASFSYTVFDGTDSSTATVSGTVTEVPEALTISNVKAEEGGSLVFTVTLDNAVASSFTVDLSAISGSATIGDDFSGSQTLTFAGTPGETQTFTVTTVEENLIETDETFTVVMSNISNTAVDITETAIGTITDNDARPDGIGLTTDVELIANGSGGFDLVIEDVETDSPIGFASDEPESDSSDNLVVERVGTNYVIRDTGNLSLGSPIIGATRGGNNEILVPVAMVTGDIIIRTGIDDDTVIVGDLGASLAGGLFIDTEDASGQFNDFDTIDYGSVSTIALDSDSRFQAETITGLANSQLEATGTGTVFWDAGRNILMSAGSEVASDTGDITYEANLVGQFTDNFAAIVLKGAEITSASGDIALTGRAGNTGVYNRGVLLYLDAATATTSAITTGGDASIAITGTGGGSSLFGTGVEAIAATLTAAGTGSVSIDGTGGDGTMFNDGISLQKFTTVDSGTGEIALNGTGGSTGQFNRGLNLGASSFGTVGGDIFLDGTGGGTGMYGKGVQTTMSDFTTSAAGTITILGTGADGTMGGMGVHLASGSSFNTQDGDIRVEGTGDGSTMSNIGVQVTAATVVSVTGSGNVTMIGTGGAGTTQNRGIEISHSSIQIATGAIALTGSSLGSGSSNTGITIEASQLSNTGANAITLTGSGSGTATGFINKGVFLNGSSIDALGSGDVILTGTGGSGSMFNMGVKLGARSAITLASGDLAITGSGGGTSMGGIGVSIEAASSLTAGLNGDITLIGTGANGTMMNDGVRVVSFSTITTNDGDLSVTGTGQGTLHLNNGVKLSHATLSSTGLGNLSITGTGSQSASGIFNVGVNMVGGSLSTLSGSLTLDGQSGTGSTLNQGIRIIAAKLGSTGGGGMSLTGRASGSTTGVLNSGVYLLSVGFNTSGSIGVTGFGGGGTLLNHGIYMGGITATGSNPTTSGTAGAGKMSDDEDGTFFA